MPRIVGVDVPNNKPAWIALTYIHGVGVHRSKKILAEIGVDVSLRAGKLTEDEVSRIAQIIDRDYEVEGTLRRRVSQNIVRLKDIACYRGIGIVAVCRFVASRPRVMPVPVRVRRRPLPVRRALRNCVNCFPAAA